MLEEGGRTLSKWLHRFREEGEDGVLDRSSAPRLVPGRTPEERVAVTAALRRLRMTAAEIAETLAMPLSTRRCSPLSGLAGCRGWSRLSLRTGTSAKWPSELLHVDVKKLGRIGRPRHRVKGDRRTTTRGIVWEFVHVCVYDATRIADVEVLEDEKETTAADFLRRAVAHYRAHEISLEWVLTDDGSAYRGVVPLACRTVHPHHARRLGLRGDLPQTATNVAPPSPTGSTSTNRRRPHGSLSQH